MLVFVLALLLCPMAGFAACSNDVVELRGDWGQTQFRVEVVDTVETRARGLMFREEMARNAGMLFVYEEPVRAVFWMKNTLIPLDMIFADGSGRVTHVHHEAIPGDLTGIDGGEGVVAVLEINGGLARRYGIAAGSDLRHPAISGSQSVWPC